jgi:phosphoribosylanthranilate isomerase
MYARTNATANEAAIMNRRIRVKFCGLRRPQDVQLAVQLGVDYIGFILVPGTPRSLTGDEAQGILRQVDCSTVCRVGVFRNQPIDMINHLVAQLSLDLVQLHGSEDADFAQQVQVPIIRVVPVAVPGTATHSPAPADPAHLASEDAAPSAASRNQYAVLLDASLGEGQSGGLGILPDAPELRRLRRLLPAGTRVFLAGGLTANNVRDMVQQHPVDAVDVSSGIESAPGIKDPNSMRAFLEALRGEA